MISWYNFAFRLDLVFLSFPKARVDRSAVSSFPGLRFFVSIRIGSIRSGGDRCAGFVVLTFGGVLNLTNTSRSLSVADANERRQRTYIGHQTICG
jgi:hypothetical protein